MKAKRRSYLILAVPFLILFLGCAGGGSKGPLISKDDLAAREAKLKDQVEAVGRDQERLQRVGHQLLAAMPAAPAVEFLLVEDDVVNLGGTPSTVAVTSGLMEILKSDDELACLLGHQLVHLRSRHIEESVDAGLLMKVLAGVVEVASPEGKKGLIQVGDTFGIAYDEEQESEADATGLQYAYQAGYDPMAGYVLWEWLATEVPRRISGPLFTSHPVTVDRLVKMKAVAEAILAGGGY